MTLLDVPKSIRIASKAARLRFITCGEDCHKLKGCEGNCCESSSGPAMVAVSGVEGRRLINEYGVGVSGGMLVPDPVTGKCPFKSGSWRCTIHFSGLKPFGCWASPFALNKNDTLIIRFRYIHLPCYDPQRGQPAYKAFRSSLVAIFGEEQTSKLTRHLDKGGGDISVPISDRSYRYLRAREKTLRAK